MSVQFSATARFHRVFRSREVGQSYLTSILSTARSLWDWIPLVLWRVRPELVLTNGPGTCVPLLWLVWLARLMGALPAATYLVYVESVCRVQSLSLSGRLVYPICDRFVVQWPQLRDKFPRATYLGRLI